MSQNNQLVSISKELAQNANIFVYLFSKFISRLILKKFMKQH